MIPYLKASNPWQSAVASNRCQSVPLLLKRGSITCYFYGCLGKCSVIADSSSVVVNTHRGVIAGWRTDDNGDHAGAPLPWGQPPATLSSHSGYNRDLLCCPSHDQKKSTVVGRRVLFRTYYMLLYTFVDAPYVDVWRSNRRRGWSSLVVTQPSTSHQLLCVQCMYVCICVCGTALSDIYYSGPSW